MSKLGRVDSIYGAATLSFKRSEEGKPLLHLFTYFPNDMRRASNLIILSEFGVKDLRAALDKFDEMKNAPLSPAGEAGKKG